MATLTTCKTCGKQVSTVAPVCPHCGEVLPGQRVKCPKCGSANVASSGQQGFSLKKAAVGGVLLGPLGLLGGVLGQRNVKFLCHACGHRWQMSPAQLSTPLEVGTITTGKITHTTYYGAFVEVLPDVTGMIHISALSNSYVERVEDVVRPGDQVTVQVVKSDAHGRIALRRITADEEA